MQGHTVVMRFEVGHFQVLYLLAGVPQHAKAFPLAVAGALDSMQYSMLDWAQDGAHYADEYSAKLVDVRA